MRAALYARVSTEEQTEGYSINAQIRAFNALCQGRGWTSYREYIEAGKSAHTDNINKRPVFKEAIEDALSGKYDVLVVHKIDRFARKLQVTLEYFNKLSEAGVGFVSIQNEIDYTTSQGKLMLSIQGALAEYYSDNLSEECKKGWTERKRQGLYCGLLPFGAMKGKTGIPKPDPQTYPVLLLAFELKAQGKTDRQIAMILNDKGYRTSGNHGSNPFSNDTVAGILTNRFYIGELPYVNGGHIKAKHKPFIDRKLWNAAQESRARNKRSPIHCSSKGTLSSLTGYTYCWKCKGRMRTGSTKNGKKRIMCSEKVKGTGCNQKSAIIDVYERQIEAYLENFIIPGDYIDRIIEMQKKLEASYDENENRRNELVNRLERNKRLFKWGDISEADYLIERAQIKNELDRLTPHEYNTAALEKLAELLKNVPQMWKEANQEQRNALGRQLFEEIWIEDKRVVAVKPTKELEPFFKVSYEEWLKGFALATPMGFEPTIFGVTGRYVRPLHHGAAKITGLLPNCINSSLFLSSVRLLYPTYPR